MLAPKKQLFILRGLYFVIMFSIWYGNIFAQMDTAFWFAAPDLHQSHGDRPIFLRTSTNDKSAKVTISIPANPAFVPITYNLSANSTQSIDLTPYIDLFENSVSNSVLKKGLYISSSTTISCYYDIANAWNGDIYSLKGQNALGFKFTIPFQMAFTGNPFSSSFSIIATEDNTTITITPKNDLLTHSAGISFSIILNKGETYTCESVNNVPSMRPGGTIVSANKKIAISIKDDSIAYPGYGCGDTAGDQLVSDCNAGTDFAVVRGFFYGNNPDNYYVFALVNGTQVSVDGNLVITIKAGEFYRGLLSNPSCFVQTSQPVHLFHISGFGCEIGGAVVPSLNNVGSSLISITRATSQAFFINVLAPASIISGFTVNSLNSVITPFDFQAVPATNGGWMIARISIPLSLVSAGGNVRLENSIGNFHAGIIHGDQTSTTRYGYFTDFEKINIEINANDSLYCTGDDVNITASSSVASNFIWSGPNGFSSIGSNLIISNFQLVNQGYYSVSAYTQHCGKVERKIYLGMKATPRVVATKSNDINCAINKSNLQAIGADKYSWYPISSLNNSNTSNPIANPNVTTIYTVIGTSVNGCRDSAIVTVNVDLKKGGDYFVPNAFTPNNDGLNDCIRVIYSGTFQEFEFNIYNRWGQWIFHSTDPTKCWDGNLKGIKQKSDVYVYWIRSKTACAEENTFKKGTLVLIR